MESVVMLSSIFAKYEFELIGKHNPESAVDSDLGMTFGATIHTAVSKHIAREVHVCMYVCMHLCRHDAASDLGMIF
jgi:hypothetical protein